jgi:hypothetical protein
LQSAFGGQRLAGAFEINRLKSLDQIFGRSDVAGANVGDVPHVHQRLLASLYCRPHLSAEPLAGEGDALTGDQFAIEPGRAIMADLLVEAGGRQHTDPDVGAIPREIVSLTTLGKIGRNAPMIRVHPLGMPRPAQRLQLADMGANKSLRVAAKAVDGRSRSGAKSGMMTPSGQDNMGSGADYLAAPKSGSK